MTAYTADITLIMKDDEPFIRVSPISLVSDAVAPTPEALDALLASEALGFLLAPVGAPLYVVGCLWVPIAEGVTRIVPLEQVSQYLVDITPVVD